MQVLPVVDIAIVFVRLFALFLLLFLGVVASCFVVVDVVIATFI